LKSLKYIEEKSIKAKKKLIDKLVKLRQDNENALGGASASGLRKTGVFGEQ
jgi:hypothetical protein